MSELLAPSQMVKSKPPGPRWLGQPWARPPLHPTSRQLAGSWGSISSRVLPPIPHGVSRHGLWSGPRLWVLWPHTLHDGQFSAGARVGSSQRSFRTLLEGESQVGETIQVVHGWMSG